MKRRSCGTVCGALVLSTLVFSTIDLRAQTVQPGVSTHTVECEHRSNQYQLFAPDSARVLPAILLLHGAGGEPNDVMEPWLKLGRKKGIVLIAPVLPRLLSYEAVAPAIFRCVVEDARKLATVDSSRIYLFGYSMGGYLALDAAMYQSEYFAGAMIYANGLSEDYYSIVDHATRRIPIALYGGDRDQVYPIIGERRTHDYLVSRGFKVHYREIEGQEHYYTPVAHWVNQDAWGWITRQK
jgi:predicted esterase